MNKINLTNVQQQFPMIQELEKQAQVYLDNASTTQKPRSVINEMDYYWTHQNANARRGMSHLSYDAEEVWEKARQQVAQFIHAPHPRSVVFTKSTTESINIVAHGYANRVLQKGDVILVSAMEHHSNLIPWQEAARKAEAQIIPIPINSKYTIHMAEYRKLLKAGSVKLVAITHVSNVFGTITPIKEIIQLAHQYGARVIVDGAQAISHIPVDVEHLDADFYAFSGHKLYGPTGVGILYGKQELLEMTEPLLYGGSMIEHVTWSSTSWDVVPYKFEGGTQNVAGAVGLIAAINFLTKYTWNEIINHERALVEQLINKLRSDTNVILYLPKDLTDHTAIISFTVKNIHPHDIGQVLDAHGVTVRTGHHCAEPLMNDLGIPGTVRFSVGIYNSSKDVAKASSAMREVKKRFPS